MDPTRKLPFFRGTNQLNFIQQRELNSALVASWSPFVNHGIATAKNFYRKNLVAHFGCVNAIEFSKDGQWLVSGGDDRRVLMWNVSKAIHGIRHQPFSMQGEHASNIFALATDQANTKIYSGGNDDQVIVHDVQTRVPLDCFQHEQPVFGISVNPINDSIFATACDSGRVCIYDIRDSNADPLCVASASSAFHGVMFNPVETRLIVTANSKKGISLFDVRYPKRCLMKYGGNNSDQCCMSAKFSADGRRIFALRRRLPPVLYSTDSTNHLYQFNHLGYYNSCTMKSCSFAGEYDSYVLSGSDNFDLYLWKIPSPEPPTSSHKRYIQSAQLVLKGHRSIVNQVRYNPVYSLIASSGVEKIIKFFSPFSLPSSQQGKSSWELPSERERSIYSHDDYIDLIMQSGQFASLTFDQSRRNTKEDPRMMAFFDALVQRDIEGMDERDNESATRTSYTNTAFSFSSIFSEDSRSGSDVNTRTGADSDDTASSTNETARSENIQVVQFPRMISDSSDEDSVPVARREADSPNQNEDESIELELVSNAAESNENQNRRGRNATTNQRRTDLHSSGENSSPNPDDENTDEISSDEQSPPVKRSDNIITQMIATRQEILSQLARAEVKLEIEGKLARRRRRREAQQKTKSSSSSSSSASSSSSSSTSTSTSSSESDSSSSDSTNLSNLRKKIRPLLWRKNKQALNPTSESDDEESQTSNPKRKKRLKSNRKPLQNKKQGASQETLLRLKAYLNTLKDASPTTPNATNSEISPNRDSEEPCTSASVLLRDAIAAGLSQSNVIYDEPNSNESSISSSSTTSSSTDSALERLVPNEVNPAQRRKKANVRISPEDDSQTFNNNNLGRCNGLAEKLNTTKRSLPSNSKSLDLGIYSDDNEKSEEDVSNLLPVAKSHHMRSIKRPRKGDSSDEESPKRQKTSESGNSFATPDSGIESSRNGASCHSRRNNVTNVSDSNSSSTSPLSETNNGGSPVATSLPKSNESIPEEETFKKHDKPATKKRNYRSRSQNDD